MSESSDLAFIPLDQIRPNPEQPRAYFDEAELRSLAVSIADIGIQQPVLLRGPYGENGNSFYHLIDGERRVRASKMAGKTTIPAYIKYGPEELQGAEQRQLAMIANLVRSDLNPIEEARAYRQMMLDGLTIRRLCEVIDRSSTHVFLRMKLLNFEPEIQEFFAARKLPIDPPAIYGIANLPDELRLKVATGFAMRGTSTSAIRATCTRITNASKSPGNERTYDVKKTTPAIAASGVEDSPSLKALSAAGRLPGWTILVTAAQETCDSCSIADVASDKICRECPVVDFLTNVKKVAERQQP